MEDASSRTILVANVIIITVLFTPELELSKKLSIGILICMWLVIKQVHFGATKDSLSRHFNKFGEVLKAVIVTDPATGQPSG